MLQLSFLRFVRYVLQCRWSCSMTPKYLTWLEKLRYLVVLFFLSLNNTISVLLAFNDNLFALIQLVICQWGVG